MARQPLILALAVGACTTPLEYLGAFDVPVTAAVLQPEVGGPFTEPVGFVANGHGGQIVPLALRSGRFLTDQSRVSFLRGSQLATGEDRQLNTVAVYAPPDRDEVTLFAGDTAFSELVRVPYLVGPDRQRAPTTVVDAANIDLSKAEGVRIADLSVTEGTTTTETWAFRFEDGAFRARGSRSGLQTDPIVLGEPWASVDNRVEITLEGTAAEGDQFTLSTDNGVTTIDVGGSPQAALMAPDQSALALIVKPVDGPAELLWMDPDSEALTLVPLPAGAAPHRLSWAESGDLLVADRARPSAYAVAPASTTVTEYELPWPTLDVESLETSRGSLLYAVQIDGRSMWLLDRSTGALLDVNPLAPGTQGMDLVVPVQGIAAMAHDYLAPELTDDVIQRRVRSVAIVDHGGHIQWAHADTGCLVQDALGPRTENAFVLGFEQVDFERSFEGDASVVSGPRLERNAINGRSVLVHPCAGIGPAERWTLTYDQPLGAWTVEGDLSGMQESLAVENTRYHSDEGEVSFVIRAGSQATEDGWRINFVVNDGVAKAIGDFDGEETRENALRIPGDPVYFYYREAATGGIDDPIDDAQWVERQINPYILLPGGSSNVVGRVNPRIPVNSPTGLSPEIEVTWE